MWPLFIKPHTVTTTQPTPHSAHTLISAHPFRLYHTILKIPILTRSPPMKKLNIVLYEKQKNGYFQSQTFEIAIFLKKNLAILKNRA